jgi:antitoxin (DNA-binding transcriptional repressor) of toxin-antitoxin stability system
MEYTTYQARTNLSRLLREAEAEQEVIVLHGKKPIVKIEPIQPLTPQASKPPVK